MRELIIENKYFNEDDVSSANKNYNEKIKFSKSVADNRISLELSPGCNSSILKKIQSLRKEFCSISWHIHNENELENPETIPAIKLSKELINREVNVIMHITCRALSKHQAHIVLQTAKQAGIRNLLVLQGDIRYDIDKKNDFCYAIDLLKYVRELYGDYFSIGVAGYPTSHPRSKSLHDDLKHLKSKIDAKADFMVTQGIFNYETFSAFKKKCRSIDIKIPIIPGVFVFTSRNSLMKILKFCEVRVPDDILEIVDKNKHNPLSVYNFGLDYTTELIKKFLTDKKDPVFVVHLFTLNKIWAVEQIFKRLGFCNTYIERPLLLISV